LFNIEEGNKISIFAIKSFVNNEVLRMNNAYYLKQSKIKNFKMAKKVSLQLEMRPKSVEFYGNYFLIVYRKPLTVEEKSIKPKYPEACTFIDMVEKSGEPVNRIDISEILERHSIMLKKITQVKIPRLAWSNRNIE
jgi:hypothetical protein